MAQRSPPFRQGKISIILQSGVTLRSNVVGSCGFILNLIFFSSGFSDLSETPSLPHELLHNFERGAEYT